MELLKFFPLNRKISDGQRFPLLKTTAKYFLLFIVADILIGIVYKLHISFIAKGLECILMLYISAGMILAVFMFLLQENKDTGKIQDASDENDNNN